MAKQGWTRSPVVGILVGVFAGGLVILLAERAGHALLGTAELSDLSSVTTPMWAAVLVAWILGSAAGGAVATRWTRDRPVWAGLIAGAVLLLGAVSNMFAFPHPAWMIVAAVVLMPAAAWLAARSVGATATTDAAGTP